LLVAPPTFVGLDIGRPIEIVKAIYRATPVSMEPCPICTERNEVCERSVGIVPHDEDEDSVFEISTGMLN